MRRVLEKEQFEEEEPRRRTSEILKALREALAEPGAPLEYAIAVVSVALATTGTIIVHQTIDSGVTLLFIAAVMVSAWYGGIWPGVLATTLSLLSIPSLVTSDIDPLILAIFAAVALIITALNALHQRAEAALRHRSVELSETVAQATAELFDAGATLRETEERFRSLFEQAPVAYHEIDRDGTVCRVNSAECELLIRSAQEMLGRPIWEFVAPEQRETSRREVLMKLAGARHVAPFTREYIRSDGIRLTLEIHENLIRDRIGAISGIRSTLLDMTERVRAEEHIRQLNAELEKRVQERTADLQRSNEALQQFAYSASHDLQEPLRMISSYTQLLARRYRDRFDGEAQEFIDYVVEGTSRMSELIKDLLAFSRAGASSSAAPESIEMMPLIERAIRNLEAAFEESGAVLTTDEFPLVNARAAGLAQVLQNLIGNAIKYRGPHQPRIHVSSEESDTEWIFCVADNGLGFEPAQAERIFGIFKRLHGRQYPGTGIGLAICKRIIETGGGRIWAESEPGTGSKFYFTLPKANGARAQPPA